MGLFYALSRCNTSGKKMTKIDEHSIRMICFILTLFEQSSTNDTRNAANPLLASGWINRPESKKINHFESGGFSQIIVNQKTPISFLTWNRRPRHMDSLICLITASRMDAQLSRPKPFYGAEQPLQLKQTCGTTKVQIIFKWIVKNCLWRFLYDSIMVDSARPFLADFARL